MSGRDVIGVAKTGSGKTLAFLLPMFRHIKDQRPLEALEGPIAMIMTPTRELATQIYKEGRPFLKALGLRVSQTVTIFLKMVSVDRAVFFPFFRQLVLMVARR